MMKNVILITGAARSGTSMVTGTLDICGAFGGGLAGPHKNNPKGMFENAAIRSQLVKPYLKSIGVDPFGQFPLADPGNLSIPVDWKDRVLTIMKVQGLKKGMPWFYKCPKMGPMWPVWHYAFPDAKWIIVRRRSADIVNSCMKTSFMRAFTNPKNQRAVGVSNERQGWLWWVRQHEKCFADMLQAGLNAKVVWPERMVNGNYQQMYEALEWLGLKWKSEVLNFIDPKLWKVRRK